MMNVRSRKLTEVFQSSTFRVMPGLYTYAKVRNVPKIPGKHFMLATDNNEITVVTKKSYVKGLDIIAKNKEDYRLIALNVSIPFYSVGFLAAVSSAIARKNANLLIVSTYSKDYILVSKRNLSKARLSLLSLGMQKAD